MTRSVTARGELRGHLKSLHSLDSSVPASALFVCACERSRKVVPLIACPTFASVLPPFCRSLRRVSSVLRSAAERRRRRQLARSLGRLTQLLSPPQAFRQAGNAGKQSRQAGRRPQGCCCQSNRAPPVLFPFMACKIKVPQSHFCFVYPSFDILYFRKSMNKNTLVKVKVLMVLLLS